MTATRRAFTYIELCVVLAIIAILAAILFPVFARAREKARQTACANNLSQIGLALRMYAEDNYSHFPAGDDDLTALAPRYLPDRGVFQCPSAPALGYQPKPGEAQYLYRGGFAVDDDPTTFIAVDINETMHNGGFNGLAVDGHTKWQRSQGTYDPYRPFRKLAPPPSPTTTLPP